MPYRSRTHSPSLFVTIEELDERRHACAGTELEEWGKEVVGHAEKLLGGTDEFPIHEPENQRQRVAVGTELLVAAWLYSGDERFARAALERCLLLLKEPRSSDLGKAAIVQLATVVFDLCGAQATNGEDEKIFRILRGLIDLFEEFSDDNPDNPFNNWWGVTHSSRGLAALCLKPYDPSLEPVFEDCVERIRSYLMNYGDHGHYYEGTGYGQYSFSHWGPFLLAAEKVAGTDLADWSPGARRMPALVAALTVAKPQIRDADLSGLPPRIGRRAFWNDDGGGAASPGLLALEMMVAPPQQRAALRAHFDSICGSAGDASWTWPLPYLPFVFLGYPLKKESAQPLPMTLVDRRCGLVVFRNRYKDAGDSVFAAYAKSFHGGGHNQEDAGSIRFISGGGEWSQCGGQNKPQPFHQSVPMLNRRQRPESLGGLHPAGKILYFAPGRPGAGGSVSLRLDKVYGVPRLDRHFAVAYDSSLGEAVLVVADRYHSKETEEWTWTLALGSGIEADLLPDHRGFLLRDPVTAGRMRWDFLLGGRSGFSLREGDKSERTFSGGRHVVYPPERWVETSVMDRRGTFFAIGVVNAKVDPSWQFDEGTFTATDAVSGTRIRLDFGHWNEGPVRILPADGTPAG